MRTKTLIDGFKNSQKLRLIINGIIVYTTVKGVLFDLFGSSEQRAAVCDTLMKLSFYKRTENAMGLADNFRGYSVQVDLL